MINFAKHSLLIYLTIMSFHAGGYAANTDTAAALALQREGLSHLIQFMDDAPDIFNRPSEQTLLLNRHQKDTVLEVWSLYLDYMGSLQTISEQQQRNNFLFWKNKDRDEKLYSLAFHSHYRYGLEFINRISLDPELVTWLNTAHPSKQLTKNFYNRFSDQILGAWMTESYDTLMASYRLKDATDIDVEIEIEQYAVRDLNRSRLLVADTKKSIGKSLYSVFYPVQKGVARGMGKVKVWRIGKTLITPEQALEFSRDFEPGDFHLTRKEWRLTNVGIPGFWTHSAMFIGTAFERAEYFDDPDVLNWANSLGAPDFESLLKMVSPVYAAHPGYDELGDIRVIEALDAGVIFNSIETSLDADGAVVFRPRLSKLEKAKAIYNAFYYSGRPYDFHFAFDSDDALVCTELIFKAYQSSDTQAGIPFPLNRTVGKKMLSPAEIAQWYEANLGTDQQHLDLVMFIDSNEKDRVAFQSTPEAFIGSWKRPDWYIFQQPQRETAPPQSTTLANNP